MYFFSFAGIFAIEIDDKQAAGKTKDITRRMFAVRW